MSRKSIDEQLRDQEREDREKREARNAPAGQQLFRLQLEGLISVAADPSVKRHLEAALATFDAGPITDPFDLAIFHKDREA